MDMSKREIAYFEMAKTMSSLSDHKQQLGCVVVNKHRVISTGHNSQSKSHALQAKMDQKRFGGFYHRGCVHAETDALLPLIRENVDLSHATIYVYRQHKNGIKAIARPCPGCESLIRACGIKKIYYTVENSYAKETL